MLNCMHISNHVVVRTYISDVRHQPGGWSDVIRQSTCVVGAMCAQVHVYDCGMGTEGGW